jgi:hypothetical protein
VCCPELSLEELATIKVLTAKNICIIDKGRSFTYNSNGVYQQIMRIEFLIAACIILIVKLLGL